MNLQVLCQKSCVRFFNSLNEHPRFITDFVHKLSKGVDPDLLGRSTLTWWPEVQTEYGNITTVNPLYNRFRDILI